MHRQELLNLLKQYHTRYMEESAYVRRAIDYIELHEDCFYRELWPMHVTGSAWVMNSDRDKILMLHHKKHDQWFQPGGHADGDADIVRVALREASEETGIDISQVKLVSSNLFDVDIHDISAMGSDPQHSHIDIRFLMEIDEDLVLPGNDESNQVQWVSVHEVARYNNNLSTVRMLAKTRKLRNIFST